MLLLLATLPLIVLFRSSYVLSVFVEKPFVVIILAVLGALRAGSEVRVLDVLAELFSVLLGTLGDFRPLFRLGRRPFLLGRP